MIIFRTNNYEPEVINNDENTSCIRLEKSFC